MAVTEYTWNPLTDSVIEETDGAGNVLVEYTNEPAPYGPLISERRGAESRQYHFDALGSTRALTDDSQAVTDTFAYDAWGNGVERSGTSSTPFMWVGDTGYSTSHLRIMVFIRHRQYTPGNGVWKSEEPLDLFHLDYAYASNSPIQMYDPSGLACSPTPNGVVYVAGRGQFSFYSMTPYSQIRQWWQPRRVGSSFDMSWGWTFDPSPFFDLNGDCCCCESVGFLQIARKQAIWGGGFFEMSGWFVDGGVPYDKGADNDKPRESPCKPGRGAYIKMSDTPNTVMFKGRGFRLEMLFHEFETCSVCLSGREGLHLETILPIDDMANMSFSIKGVTVYGCVRHSHLIVWRNTQRDYEYFRYIDAPVSRAARSAGDTARVVATNFAGAPPSSQFESTVIGHHYSYP